MARIDNSRSYFDPNDGVKDFLSDEQQFSNDVKYQGRLWIDGYPSSTKFKVFDVSGNSIFNIDTSSPRVDVFTPNFYVNNVLYSGGGVNPNDGTAEVWTDQITIQGINSNKKLELKNNSGTVVFNVDTNTPQNTSNAPLQITGSDDVNKLVVKNNSNSNIFNVNTLNGITSLSNSNSTQLSMSTSGSISGIGFNTSGFSKNLQMNSGVFFVDGAFSPNINQTYDLGGSLQRWNSIFGSQIDVLGGITSSSGANGTQPNRLTLTNSGTGANTGVQISLNGHNGTSAQNSTINFNGSSLTFTIPSAGNYVLNATTRPSTNGTLALGSSSNRWSTLFCNTLDVSANSSGVIVNRASFINGGTGAGTGTSITFTGHNGTSARSATIDFNGDNISLRPPTGGGVFSQGNFAPTLDNSVSCGTLSNRWTQLYASTTVINTSDQREKNTITNEDLGLDFVCQLRPVKYKFNVQYNQIIETPVPRVDENGDPVYEQVPVYDEEGNQMYDENGSAILQNGPQIIDIVQSLQPVPGTKYYHGLIAQEVESVLEDFNMTSNDFAGLNKDDPNRYGLGYTEFLAPMIKSIQELKSIVDQQQSTINSLQNQINQILNL